MRPAILYALLKRTYDVWTDARAPTLGAALAYYTIFSITPLLVIALAVAALIFGPQAARNDVAGEIQDTVGPTAANAIQDLLKYASNPSSGVLATILGFAVLLFGASGVFAELQNAINTIWRVEPKPHGGVWNLIRSRFLSFTMVLGTCFLLLVSLLVSVTLQALTRFWTPQALPGGAVLWLVLNNLISLAVVTLLFAMIFKFLPDARIAWRDVWIGALTTAVLFTLGKYLLGLYLSLGSVASPYGAAGSLVLILVWVYYSAQIFLLGAALTYAYANRFGEGVRPAENAVALESGSPREHAEVSAS